MEHAMNEPIAPRRRLRNYLLDARFQLKGVGLIVGAAALVALVLGGFLWQTSSRLVGEAEKAVSARSEAAQASKELGDAALNNELLKRFDDPGFKERLQEQSRRIDEQYANERDATVAQQHALLAHQQTMALSIVASLLALVLLIVLVAVIATHKIAGPAYRLKRLMQQVGTGNLDGVSRLRKGDELQDLFLEFSLMIERLNRTQGNAIALLDGLIARAKGTTVPAEILEGMQALRTDLDQAKLVLPAPADAPKQP
jgi:methyl-accepting chemotaxis protein